MIDDEKIRLYCRLSNISTPEIIRDQEGRITKLIIRLGLSEQIPDFSWIESLTSLSLEVRMGQDIPDHMGNYSNLRELEIRRYPNTTLGEPITLLDNLEELQLPYSQVTVIDPSINQLKKLRKLNLFGNKVSFIPPQLFDLNLKAISFYHNQIRDVPLEIIRLDDLRYLDFTACELSIFPPHLLDLQKLEYLSLSGVIISRIPDEIHELTKLRYLGLGSTAIDSLPPTVMELEDLEYLSIYQTRKMKTLPLEYLEAWTNLRRINIIGSDIDNTEEVVEYCDENGISCDLGSIRLEGVSSYSYWHDLIWDQI